jgi:hypothetical protein
MKRLFVLFEVDLHRMAGGAEFHFVGVGQPYVEQACEDDSSDKDDAYQNNGNLARTVSEHTPPSTFLHIRIIWAAGLEEPSIAIRIKRFLLNRWDVTSTLIYMQNLPGNKGI